MKTICLLTLLVFLFSGCPSDAPSSGPVEVCESVGTQCRMGGGKLGVCTAQEGGAQQCASQH